MKVKEEDKYNGSIGLTLKEENEILKVVLKEYVRKSITYKELMTKVLKLLDKYQ